MIPAQKPPSLLAPPKRGRWAMEEYLVRIFIHLASASLSALLAMTWAPAWGAGPTGEEEALGALNTGRYPITLSADGQWIFHVDAHNVLHRKRVGDEKTVESIDLILPAQALSTSRSGKKVGFITTNACIGVATFTRNSTSSQTAALDNAPSLIWLDRSLNNSSSNIESCPGEKSKEDSYGNIYGAFAVALSSDGTLIAIAGNPIKVIDIASQRIVQEVPTGEVSILHMRFVDADRKLLVVQALMGEQWESAATGSDMQFAVWDLQKKELFSFHNTKTTGTLINYDFLWNFSDLTGELWAINTNGNYGEADPTNPDKQKLALIRPYTTNLKRCSADKQTRIALPPSEGDGLLGFTVDPLGRYIAGVLPTFDVKLKRATSTLWVRNSRTGKILSEWHLNDELRALTTSNDGKVLYGTIAGQPKSNELSYTRYGWSFTGGGKLMKFDLSSRIATLPSATVNPWSEQSCLIEDEEPHAREIVIDTKTRPRLFEVQLREHPRQSSCVGDDIGLSGGGNSTVWHQKNDGSLWVDRWSTLERIDSENSHVLQQIPTPRTDSVCSLPLYEQRQFLSWQGDTISLRQFAETLTAGDRKVLVKKPGWFATRVNLLGDHFGVRWVDARYKEDETEHGEGSAVAIEYDMSGKELRQTRGRAVSGMAVFAIEDGEGGEDVFSEHTDSSSQLQGPYRWERSYTGSVRAYRVDTTSNTKRTVLWSGLRLGLGTKTKKNSDMGTNVGDGTAGRVVDLGGSLGALVDSNSIKVFDAANRHQLALIKVENAQNVAWNPVNRVLVVESFKFVTDQPGIWKLSGYRIE